MSKFKENSEYLRYRIKETIYINKAQETAITKAEGVLGFPSRSALLRRAIAEGLKKLDRYLPPENF